MRSSVLLVVLPATLVFVACGLTVVGAGGGTGDAGAPDGRPPPAILPDIADAADGRSDGEAGAPDAASECPTICNGGCATGSCLIEEPSAPVTCPPGIPCRVTCTLSNVCRDVSCGAASSCRVECSPGQSCSSMTIDCGSASCAVVCGVGQGCNSVTLVAASAQLCLECGGVDGCNSVSCGSAAPGAACAGSSCASVAGCGAFVETDACP